MARDFSSVVTEAAGRLRMDVSVAAELALVQGWLNDTIQDVHGRYDWFWVLDRQIVQTVADYTTGTVSVSAGGQAVTGSSTAFASSHVGSFINFQGSEDWYKITAVSSVTALTIEAPYAPTTALSAGTFIIRKMFYSLPNAEKMLGVKQAGTRRDLICINHRDFDSFLTFADDTAKASLFCVYGIDSSGYVQFNIYPHADSIYNLEVKYKKKATQDSISLVPEKWISVYIDGTLARGLEYIALGNNELAKSSALRDKRGDYERGINRMMADAQPQSSYRPVLMNRDVPCAFPRNHLPTGMSIPLDD